MTLEQTLSFVIFSLVAAIVPGPGNAMITATASLGRQSATTERI